MPSVALRAVGKPLMTVFAFWEKEWPVITAAPHLVIGGAVALVIATVGILQWAFARERAGYKATIAARMPSLIWLASKRDM
jgi:hypothetical protein